MLKNNIKIAWRSLKKDRQFTLLNLVGLSTGLACVLFIYLWVSDELSVDKFNKNDNRLYKLLEHRKKADGIWTAHSSAFPTAAALAAEMPEVEYAALTSEADNIALSVDGTTEVRAGRRFVSKDFFKVFSYEILQGNSQQVLPDKNSMAISDELAHKLFNTTEGVIGKTITYQHDKQYTISAIFKSPPVNASEQFDLVLSTDILKDQNSSIDSWFNTGPRTYVLLKPGADPSRVDQKLPGFIMAKTNNQSKHKTPFLKRYSEIYLYGEYENGVLKGGRIDYVRMFSLIAIFILIIACINFMNLSTAKAAQRLKEVGVKKVMGANRRSLIIQYLGQSMLMTFFALILAFVLVFIFLPSFNSITGKQLTLVPDTRLIFSCLGIALLTGLIAGSYPAFYLSGFNPAVILKGKLRNTMGELLVRKGLVVFQFSLSVILIISVLVVYKQISYVQSRPLGYNKENMLSFNKEGKLKNNENLQTFLSEVRKVPGVIMASSIGHSLTGHDGGTSGIMWEGKDPEDRTEFENVGSNFGMIETLGFEMKEGRSFSPQFASDSNGIIFNETGIRFMGMKDPIGKTVKLWGEDRTIIGVVKDFHYESLHESLKPLFIQLNTNSSRIVARIAAGKEKETIAGIEKIYKQFNPDFTFSYTFMDDTFQRMYTSEKRVSILSRYFAGLAILISCLGLFGLAAFTAHRRQKEIGIRKVVGATANNLYLMLSKDFLKLVFIAIIIALPISWWATSHWLQGFAYRTSIGPGIFITAAIITLLITLLTISYQTIKAAIANPVHSLKSE